MSIEMVEKTWKELGFKVRPLHLNVVVRTHPISQKTPSGLLWLPPKVTSFYGQLPHQQMIKATVLSASKRAMEHYGIKIGEEIAFTRLFFAKLYDLNIEEKVGWVEAQQIAGYPED